MFPSACRVQECENKAQAQAKSLSRLRESEAENSEALELMEDKWSAAAQDAAGVVQSKESQLQEVTHQCRRTQEIKDGLEELMAELDALKT